MLTRERLIAEAGGMLEQYPGFMSQDVGQECRWHYIKALSFGDSFVIGQRRLLWHYQQTYGQAGIWQSLDFGDIKDVRPPERHGVFTYITLVKRDDSCVLFNVRAASGRSRQTEDAVRTQLLAALAASRG